ncbi:hypothetical protein [Pseudonocardia charpentierae]|uniref:Uncharacterized protein n=1 Tax=Pseudonocardia charpentierae TaxID=3075545 RepID=A0ABU2NIV0_9PSEU|nr:hypothetical protein [Pseudonocardia sp. DSM 45834]MDT0353902.1 hypothetical protein [Pseudonocardia sp. DSM 45834]
MDSWADGLTLLGDLHVQFQCGHTQLQGVGERRKAARRSQAEATAMSLDVERRWTSLVVHRDDREADHQNSGRQEGGDR